MNQTSPLLSHQYHDAIAVAARDLWEKEGRQDNRDLDYWLQAEREILAQQQALSRVEPSVLALVPQSGPPTKTTVAATPGSTGKGTKPSSRGRAACATAHPGAIRL